MPSFWETNPEAPRKGWRMRGSEDLGPNPKNFATCQACGVQTIRYAHGMTHPLSGHMLVVGYDCADDMMDIPGAANLADGKMRNWVARRANFPGLAGWKLRKGGLMVLKKDGLVFFEKVARTGRYYTSFCPEGLPKEHDKWVKVDGFYDTREEARLAAFDAAFPLSREVQTADLRSSLPQND